MPTCSRRSGRGEKFLEGITVDTEERPPARLGSLRRELYGTLAKGL